ncbi:SDR family oxidoreductase [Geoalkalibacter halelectricus]|uniref:SDR family oxidoreductase n=1 Tax=Geoalkalibacter halelectricus TaxID=2847045 RepID=A0ABY5ZR98_9BACT|nr:SDR family oxidoreductase [Geoalkalibacter halelectricus]MDO3379289.1 SDR family oxidoreductase [Geoalkalibacter halelectricus]UWZ81044.1 SDR family oxidoreductase [Geoalkalibacter halelectricus]
MASEAKAEKPILVTGATGYIGGRLVPRLLDAGYPVRAMVRNPEKVRGRAWAARSGVELTQGDVFDPASLVAAAHGCRAAYYLVHSMNPRADDFSRADRQAAQNMAAAAEQEGLEQIIYLSGLGEEGEGLSKHLRSRAEVARVLRQGATPVTVLRAAMIIGSGSASFEILRYLVERLPVMITPRWIDTPCQPIAVRNVLAYLVGCLACPRAVGETFDIGQPEIISYRRLMHIYAEEAGLRRRLIFPVPVLTPRLSSYWIHLVTPVPASLARPLAEGLRNEVVCRDHRIRDLIPQDLLDARQAIRAALEKTQRREVETSWSDAGAAPAAEWGFDHDPAWAGGTLFQDLRRILVEADAPTVWRQVLRLGGQCGWNCGDWLWRVRGLIDRLLGGVGLRRTQPSGAEPRVGDTLDFWRVAEVEPERRLLLVAEMKLPGRATLEFELRQQPTGQTELRQINRFVPRGLGGIIYWYLVTPFHALVFRGLLQGIARQAEAKAASNMRPEG